MPTELELRQLEIFLSVLETGGMTRAARALGLTQSAVSQSIRALERLLGVCLFDRSANPLRPTPAGRLLAEHAQKTLEQVRLLRHSLRFSSGATVPVLRIGIIDSLGATAGPALLTDIAALAKHCVLCAGATDLLERRFVARELDIVLGVDALRDIDDLVRLEIATEPFILAVPRHWSNGPVSIEALHDRTFIRYAKHTVLGRQVERYLRQLQIKLPCRFEVENTETLLALVAAGHGWTITTPICTLQASSHLPRVTLAPIFGPGLHRTIELLARRNELGELPLKVRESAVEAIRRELPVGAALWPTSLGRVHLPRTKRTSANSSHIDDRSRYGEGRLSSSTALVDLERSE